jgi:CRISPR/Cas system-associated endonuclease Cas1
MTPARKSDAKAAKLINTKKFHRKPFLKNEMIRFLLFTESKKKINKGIATKAINELTTIAAI